MKEIGMKIKTLRSGQIRKYGDSEYEYELEVEGMCEWEVKRYCNYILKQCHQTFKEWNEGRRISVDIHFGGYYLFEKVGDDKYRYFVHSPSTH